MIASNAPFVLLLVLITCAAPAAHATAATLWSLDTDVVSFRAYSALAVSADRTRVFVAFFASGFPDASGTAQDEAKLFVCPLPFSGDANSCTMTQLLARAPSPSTGRTGRSLSMGLANGAPFGAYFRGYGVCSFACESATCASPVTTCYNVTDTATKLASDSFDQQIAVVVSPSGATGFFAASYGSGLYYFGCSGTGCSSQSVTKVTALGANVLISSLTAAVDANGKTILGAMTYSQATQSCSSSLGMVGGLDTIALCTDLACTSATSASTATTSIVPTCSGTYRQPLALTLGATPRLVSLDYASTPSGIHTRTCTEASDCTMAVIGTYQPPTGELYQPQTVDSALIAPASDNTLFFFGTKMQSKTYRCIEPQSCSSFVDTTAFTLENGPSGVYFNEEFALAVVDPVAKSFVVSYYTSPASTPATPKSLGIQIGALGSAPATSGAAAVSTVATAALVLLAAVALALSS
eukprot:Amastigsp_a842891_120.p1 type:complete len:468 gc:universal Amastigsp_a842891_120:1422-19(-)